MQRRVGGCGAWLGVVAVAAMGLAGCGTEPPAPVILPGINETTQAPTVFLVLPGSPDAEPEFNTWFQAAEVECREAHAVLRVVGPPPGADASRMPDLIRDALRGGAAALVVVPPADPAPILPLLAEAEAKGVPVATLGAAAVANPPLPGTAVVPQPFAETAALLVRAIGDDARRLNLPTPPPTAVLFDRKGDRFGAGRVDALKAAATGAGFGNLVELGYEMAGVGEGRDGAFQALEDGLKAHPEIRAVLADGDETMAAADRVRSRRPAGDPPLLVAGYVGFRGQLNPEAMRGNSAFVEGRLDVLARVAVSVVLDRIRAGRTGSSAPAEPSRVVPTPLNRAVGDAIRSIRAPEPPRPSAPPAPGAE